MQKRLGLDLEVPDEFGYFLAGFSAGEACFGANVVHSRRRGGSKQLQVRYWIVLRADDKKGLEYIRNTLGVGTMSIGSPRKNHPNPMACYMVSRIADLYHVVVPLFEKYPIPTQFKKARDFEIWKKIVQIHYHEGGQKSLGRPYGTAPLPESYWNKIEPLVAQLKAGREFDG